jgi:iron complex outermembrane recepter protein
MSELMNARNGGRNFHWQLLTTVSALALLAAAYGTSEVKAAEQDTDRPALWIELGGQLDHVAGQGEPFSPAFLTAYSDSVVLQPTTPVQAQNPPPFSFGEEGKISFQPQGSDWVLLAAVNYGRSSNFKHVDHQTNRVFTKYPGYVTDLEKFADTKVTRRESHAILDFAAGKDVGLGLFGREGSSILSLGVRFAQFTSKENFNINARPDLQLQYKYPASYAGIHFLPDRRFHTYHAAGSASRSFHGIGPSLSWNGSAPIVGNARGGEIIFNWGANAALLFGKQKARVQHQESAHYGHNVLPPYTTLYVHPVAGHSIVRSVIAPNIGGFAGASYRIEDFKVSLGYRADFFFGAIDGGIDTRKSETLGFYGPFASVSVGLGG